MWRSKSGMEFSGTNIGTRPIVPSMLNAVCKECDYCEKSKPSIERFRNHTITDTITNRGS